MTCQRSKYIGTLDSFAIKSLACADAKMECQFLLDIVQDAILANICSSSCQQQLLHAQLKIGEEGRLKVGDL